MRRSGAVGAPRHPTAPNPTIPPKYRGFFDGIKFGALQRKLRARASPIRALRGAIYLLAQMRYSRLSPPAICASRVICALRHVKESLRDELCAAKRGAVGAPRPPYGNPHRSQVRGGEPLYRPQCTNKGTAPYFAYDTIMPPDFSGGSFIELYRSMHRRFRCFGSA